MTEKIKRRGITLPDSYHPDLLEVTTVGNIIRKDMNVPGIRESLTIKELRNWLSDAGLGYNYNTLFVSGKTDNDLLGIIHRSKIIDNKSNEELTLGDLMTRKIYSVYADNTVQLAVEFMLKTGQDVLPVVDRISKNVVGVITQGDVIKVFEQRFHEETHIHKHISMSATARRILRKGKKLLPR